MAESFARIFNFSLIASGDSVHITSRWSIPKTYFNEPGYSANGYVLFRPEFLKVTTYPFSYDVSAFVVPKAQQMPMWMNAILPFTFETWLAYVLFTTAVSLACYFLSCYVLHAEVPNFQPLEMFRLFIVGASEYPLGSSSLRLFFAANVIFNIVFNNAYTGSFSSYIMVPQFFKDFESLEEAVAGSLRVAIAFNVASKNSISTSELATGADISDPKTQLIMMNSVFVDTYASAVQMAKTARNVCVMSTGLVGLFDAYSRDNYDGNRPLLHVIPGGMMSLMYTYRTRPRFPFRSWLTAFVVGLQDLGFANKGRQELVSSIISSSSLADIGDEITPLSLEHLQTYFYLLAVGVCLSVLVFLLETASGPVVRSAVLVYLHVGRRIRGAA
ncbi:uncharacterized protein LOC134530001 [Bacillus rossius redtenbacheri]|uniref:uncharacterized protein LOC134530001 n=1 Tax=Bacillus rossius redtenbacheri TaxID=93214 RepID=UPI002FDE9FE7